MALEAGKHVIVEKPFTSTTAQGEELIALAGRKRLMLSVYQNRRWDADFLTVREIISNGCWAGWWNMNRLCTLP